MPDYLALLGCGEQVELLGRALGDVTALLLELSQNAANSRVGVLAIVNRVLRILGDGEIEVELHLRCGLAEIEEETHRVYRYLFEQVDEGYRLAGALGHTHDFAVSRQANELHEDYVELVAVETYRVKCALHSGDMTVVVCAPDIYRPVKLSDGELVAVICDIRREIGRVAVLADEHIVLETELVDLLLRFALGEQALCLNLDVLVPQRAVKLVGESLFFEQLYCVAKLRAVVQGALLEPCVVFYSVF